jgi:urea carboxylase
MLIDCLGYVVTQVVAQNDLWRLAQLRPSDKFSFTSITWNQALELEERVTKFLANIKAGSPFPLDWVLSQQEVGDGVLHSGETLTIRQAGERAILCVFDGNFSVRVRARVEQLARAFEAAGASRNMVAGNCSVYVPYDPRTISQADMVAKCIELEQSLPSVDEAVFPSRIIHLPALFDPEECHESIERYMTLQRPAAPYLPDNVDFIRRSNGLKSRLDVKNTYFEKPMLVNFVGWLMGLPIYNPLDPRDHLIVPKFNPSRNWTKAGSLGTGGMSSSIYPNDG